MKYSILLFAVVVSTTACSKFKTEKDLDYYDLTGNVAKVTTTTYVAVEKFGEIRKGKLETSLILDFNKKGNIVKSDRTTVYDSSSTSHFVITKQYNNDDKQIGYQGTSTDGAFNGIVKYDSKGRGVEEDHFDAGKLRSVNKLTYNDNDLVKDVSRYDSRGKLDSKLVFKRNSQGQIIEQVNYDSTGVADYKQSFTYDENKRVAAIKTGGKYPSNYTYKYSRFDDHGNWLTQIEYDSGKLYKLTERKISYY